MKMILKALARLRRHPWRVLILIIGLAILSINVLAFTQAWAMTHFVPSGVKTDSPEKLSTSGKLQILLIGIRVPRPVNSQTPADFGLAFTTGHCTSDGLDLETWNIPDSTDRHRATVMMYPGYSASKQSLLSAAVELHRLGCDVVLVDFRGTGGSAGDKTSIGYLEADDVIATTNQSRKSSTVPAEPVILFGQSLGAAAILRAAGDLHLPADGLLLESPYDRLLSTAENRFRSMGLPAFPAADLLIFWGGVQNGFWAFDMNPSESAARVRVSTIVFHGGQDPRVTTPQAKALFDSLAGAKRFEMYPSAGHCGFRADDPARWRKTVDEFIAAIQR